MKEVVYIVCWVIFGAFFVQRGCGRRGVKGNHEVVGKTFSYVLQRSEKNNITATNDEIKHTVQATVVYNQKEKKDNESYMGGRGRQETACGGGDREAYDTNVADGGEVCPGESKDAKTVKNQ